MGSHSAVLVEDLYGAFGGPDEDFLADKGVGHTVIVLIELNMVIDVHSSFFPGSKLIGGFWKGLQNGFVKDFEELVTRLA